MGELRSWIITLVSITVLCSIIEKFAPQGSLNKYVRLICGLAVTTVIAMPVLNFLRSDFQLDTVAWSQYMKLSEGELKSRIEKLEREDKEQMLELYRISLISDIKTRFKGHKDFVVTGVDAVLYENDKDENFGLVRSLYLTLEPAKESRLAGIDNETVNYIKNQLIGVFAIKEDQIIIDLSKFNGGE